jgi:tetratricopeptide (TPR) repeat protein
MAKTKQKKENEGIDLLESPDALASKTEEFFNNQRNKNIVFGVGGVIALIVAAFIFYTNYQNTRNQEAQEEMFQAVYYFEADSLTKALNGDGNSYGFLEIIENYGGTDAANLATYYTGAIYMNLQDYESAIRYFNDFSSGDALVQSRAYSLAGDAYMELDDFENAISQYKKAIDHKPNESFTPLYLKKLAIAYEEAGNLQEAASTYGRIVEEYFDSQYKNEAIKQKARLEGLLAE